MRFCGHEYKYVDDPGYVTTRIVETCRISVGADRGWCVHEAIVQLNLAREDQRKNRKEEIIVYMQAQLEFAKYREGRQDKARKQASRDERNFQARCRKEDHSTTVHYHHDNNDPWR